MQLEHEVKRSYIRGYHLVPVPVGRPVKLTLSVGCRTWSIQLVDKHAAVT